MTGSCQGVCPHSVAAAIATCVKMRETEGVLWSEDIAAVNSAVEHILPVSPVAALAYCEGVVNIVWYSESDEQNRITAGVATVERVLLAMTSHVEDVDVQFKGAYALAGLAIGSPVNAAGMMALGAADVLFVSADTHLESGPVQDMVSEVLLAISQEGSASCLSGR